MRIEILNYNKRLEFINWFCLSLFSFFEVCLTTYRFKEKLFTLFSFRLGNKIWEKRGGK